MGGRRVEENRLRAGKARERGTKDVARMREDRRNWLAAFARRGYTDSRVRREDAAGARTDVKMRRGWGQKAATRALSVRIVRLYKLALRQYGNCRARDEPDYWRLSITTTTRAIRHFGL